MYHNRLKTLIETFSASRSIFIATDLDSIFNYIYFLFFLLLYARLNITRKSAGSKRVFSHDVTAVILVYQNNETMAILVFPTNRTGVKLSSYVNAVFCSNNFA